jgi:glutaredoxin-related protein
MGRILWKERLQRLRRTEYPFLIVSEKDCANTRRAIRVIPEAEVVMLDTFTDGDVVHRWLLRVTEEPRLPLLFYDGHLIGGLT